MRSGGVWRERGIDWRLSFLSLKKREGAGIMISRMVLPFVVGGGPVGSDYGADRDAGVTVEGRGK